MHIITVIMLLRETAPPLRKDLHLGFPSKGGHWLGGPTANSELAALGSTDALPAPLLARRVFGLHPRDALEAPLRSPGNTQGCEPQVSEPTLCILQLTPPPTAAMRSDWVPTLPAPTSQRHPTLWGVRR